MDTGEPGPCKKPKLSIEHFEKIMYNSDEDTVVSDRDEEEIERAENNTQWVKVKIEEEECEIQIKQEDIKVELPEDEEIIWSEIPQLQSLSFGGGNELLVPLPGDRPIDIFNLLVDDAFYQLIVDETNAHAEEVMLKQGSSDHSRISRWKPVTVEEMRIFFGLILHTGTIHLARLNDYWRTDRLFNFPCFREAMGRDRFLIILRCLHFAPNRKPTDPKPDDCFFKIRPLIDYFNSKMAAIYSPGRELSIDEPMVHWDGKIIFEQTVPETRENYYAIRFYTLKDGDGLVLKFLISTGCLRDFGGSDQVVLQLLQDKLDKGHSVYIHNVYNSYSLSLQLLERKTHSTGMLPKNYEYFPENIKNEELKLGETIAGYSNGVMIGKWNDKKEITYISTEFINNLQKYFDKKCNIEREKPLPIIEYTNNMRGRNRHNEYSPYYPCQRKALFWYKKIGIHIYQLLLINSFFIYKKFVTSTSFYDFRVEVIKHLLPEKTQEVTTGTTHYLTYCPKNADGKFLRRKCKYCSDNGVRKDSSFMCKVCKVGFCMEPCFELFHKN